MKGSEKSRPSPLGGIVSRLPRKTSFDFTGNLFRWKFTLSRRTDYEFCTTWVFISQFCIMFTKGSASFISLSHSGVSTPFLTHDPAPTTRRWTLRALRCGRYPGPRGQEVLWDFVRRPEKSLTAERKGC